MTSPTASSPRTSPRATTATNTANQKGLPVKIIKRSAAAASLLSLALLTSACTPPTQAASAPASAVDAGKKLNVGFFGFAKSNGFAQGTFLGVEQAAKANNATATFVDP